MEGLSTNPSDALVFHLPHGSQDPVDATVNLSNTNSSDNDFISTAGIIQETQPSSTEKVEIWVNGVKRVIFVPRVDRPRSASEVAADSGISNVAKVKTSVFQSDACGAVRASVNSGVCENPVVPRNAGTSAVDLQPSRCVATVAPQINRELERTLSSVISTAKLPVNGIQDTSSVIKREKVRSPKDCFDYRSNYSSSSSSANLNNATYQRPGFSADHYRQIPLERLPSDTLPHLRDASGLDFARNSGLHAGSYAGLAARQSSLHLPLHNMPMEPFASHRYPVQRPIPTQVHRPVAMTTSLSGFATRPDGFGYQPLRYAQEQLARPVDTQWGFRHRIPTEVMHTPSLIGVNSFLPQNSGTCDYSHLTSAVNRNRYPANYGITAEQRPTLPVQFNDGRFVLPPPPHRNFDQFAILRPSVVPPGVEQIRAGPGFDISNRFLNSHSFPNDILPSTLIRPRLDAPVGVGLPVLPCGAQPTAISGSTFPVGFQGLREQFARIRPYIGENLATPDILCGQTVTQNIPSLPTNRMFPFMSNLEARNLEPNSRMHQQPYQHQFLSSTPQSFPSTRPVQHGSYISSNSEFLSVSQMSHLSTPGCINSQSIVMSSQSNLLLRNFTLTASQSSDLSSAVAMVVCSNLAAVAPSCPPITTLTYSPCSVSTMIATSQCNEALQRDQSPIVRSTLKTFPPVYNGILEHSQNCGKVKKRASETEPDTDPVANSGQAVSTSSVKENTEHISNLDIDVPPVPRIRIQSSGSGHSCSLLPIQKDKTKDNNRLCVSVESNNENLSDKIQTLPTSRNDVVCGRASEGSVNSHRNDDARELHDKLLSVDEQTEQQQINGSLPGSPQFISDVMEKFSDDVAVHQWLDSLMDNITESSRDSADCQPKAKSSVSTSNKTCVAAKTSAESHSDNKSSRKTNSSKKRPTWIGIKSIEAEMSPKSSKKKPSRRKRRRLTLRRDQSPDPSCDGSSDSWHPDGNESSDSSIGTVESSVPSICDSSTSSWSSNDSVTMFKRSRKNRKNTAKSNKQAKHTRHRRHRVLQEREMSPWQRIQPSQGEIIECFVSVEMLRLNGMEVINARRADEFLCCPPVRKILAKENRSDSEDSWLNRKRKRKNRMDSEDSWLNRRRKRKNLSDSEDSCLNRKRKRKNWSDSEDSWLNRKRKRKVQILDTEKSNNRIENASDSGDSYESWKPFRNKKRFLRLQV